MDLRSKSVIMVLLQGLCYVVDITMVFLTFIGVYFTIELQSLSYIGLIFLKSVRFHCQCVY